MSFRSDYQLPFPSAIGLIGISISFGFFLIVYIIGPDTFIPTQINDALTVMNMAENISSITQDKGGYYYTALALSYLTDWQASLVLIITALILFYAIFKNLKTTVAISVGTFLTIAPSILFLAIFTKDTFTPLISIIATYMLSSRSSTILKLATIIAIYVPYGLYFRQYYLIIAGSFILMTIASGIRDKRWIIPIFLVIMIILTMVPAQYYYEVGSVRDYLNRGRVWDNVSGSRTAFFNPLPPDGMFNFIINYFYAVFRLNLAVLTSPRPQELFLTLNAGTFAFLAWVGMRAKDRCVKLPTLMFIAHFLVMMLFEPDLGSYLRHASAVLPYLIPALICWDRQLFQRRRHPSIPRRSAATRHEAFRTPVGPSSNEQFGR